MIISINDSTWTGSEAFLSAAGEARYESRSWRSVSREAGVGMLFCGKRRPVLGISSEMQHDNKRNQIIGYSSSTSDEFNNIPVDTSAYKTFKSVFRQSSL
ncbi:uncharacterized [Tachysurus ichikawai]